MLDVIRGNYPLEIYLIQIVVLLLSLSFHESAHAYIAARLGDDTARERGRLSLNPLVHLDPIGTLMIVTGAPVGWAKPVPVNPNRFNRNVSVRKGMALTAIAGPLSNLILAFVGYALLNALALVPVRIGTSLFLLDCLKYGSLAFFLFYRTNVYLAVFNLLPVPPLDGSRIWTALLGDRAYAFLVRYESQIGIAFIVLILFFRSAFSHILELVASPFLWIIAKPIDLLFGLFR